MALRSHEQFQASHWSSLPFIAQIKRFGTLNETQKTTALYKVPFLKKSRNTARNWLFKKTNAFLPIFIFIQQGLFYLLVELGYHYIFFQHVLITGPALCRKTPSKRFEKKLILHLCQAGFFFFFHFVIGHISC